MIINNTPIDIQKFLNPQYTFYAHTTKEENLHKTKEETLIEHTERCISHFKCIVKEKELEEIFMKFEQLWFQGDEEKQLFRDILLNTITFHDMGKINPLFQKDKMNNPQFIKERGNIIVGSKHALLSSVFYLEYYLPKIRGFSIETKRKLRLLIYIHAYIIARHHVGMDEFDFFMKDNFIGENYEEILDIINDEYLKYLSEEGQYIKQRYGEKVGKSLDKCYPKTRQEEVTLYTYTKLLYSLLVAADYYATTEYTEQYHVEAHGSLNKLSQIRTCYETSMIVKSIRKYQNDIDRTKNRVMQQNDNGMDEYKEKLREDITINDLRTQMFIEAEKELINQKDEHIFYLEAPTGSGKSITAFNLSFHLTELCPKLKKIWYIYPFNTLVEQNKSTIEMLFGKDETIMEQIQVVNSITPIGKKKSNKNDFDNTKDEISNYVKVLLDRQFFHYPIVLSTHVTLFDTLFGARKDTMFSFYQMANSVIVLDEIQSYRNEIWTEIIIFFKEMAKLLNMKIIIMSATLPNLELLSDEQTSAVTLLKKREYYFGHPFFKDRVEISYELLEYSSDEVKDEIIKLLRQYLLEGKHILVEFLKKSTAGDFYQYMITEFGGDYNVELMTGDDNSAERSRVLQSIESTKDGEGCLLVATQVIEAGVDLKNIEIGFKNISMLDAEEQFMGRINRSSDRTGKVYFFYLDSPKDIYGKEVRVDKLLMLPQENMKKILANKNFADFYKEVFNYIIKENESLNTNKNINEFFQKAVGKLNFREVKERMYLIKDERREIPVFLARKIRLLDGASIDGKEVWSEYTKLLSETEMGYAEKKVKLHNIKSQMNYFIYKIRKDIAISYNNQIGEIYYIENGEQYFENLKLNRELFVSQNKVFI